MTLEQNPSLQVTADHRLEMVETPVGKPGPGQVLLHVKATGICGSDIHFWKTGAIGELKVLGNCTLGHEAAGQVVAVGEGVTNVAIDDRVAIEPGVPCRKCFLCEEGNYNLCEDVKFIGVYPYHGSIQRYLVHEAKYVHKLPDAMTYAEGALVEPLSVAYHGINRAGLQLGKPVLIAGSGPIGLAALLLAKASGASPIVITDLSKDRLDFAQSLVPTVIPYQIDPKKSPQETAREVKAVFGPEEKDSPQVSLECTGVASSILTCAYSTKRSGTLMVIGVGRDTIDSFPFMHLSLAEIDVKFINRYHGTWPPVIQLISDGTIDVKAFVTHTFKLEESLKAFNTVVDPATATVKVIIED